MAKEKMLHFYVFKNSIWVFKLRPILVLNFDNRGNLLTLQGFKTLEGF